jgi:hypothetical protein
MFFNLLNHPQFVPGLTNRIDSLANSYNRTAATRNYLTPGNLNFNRPDAIFSSAPRTIELALKLVF